VSSFDCDIDKRDIVDHLIRAVLSAASQIFESGANRFAENNLAASTQKLVADFRKWWSYFNSEILKLCYNRTQENSLEKVETREIELYLAFCIPSTKVAHYQKGWAASSIFGSRILQDPPIGVSVRACLDSRNMSPLQRHSISVLATLFGFGCSITSKWTFEWLHYKILL